MTAAAVNHNKPALRLKLGSSAPSDPAPHPVQKPTPPPKPAPAVAPVSIRVTLTEVETRPPSPRQINEGRAKAIAEYEAVGKARTEARIAAYEAGKLEQERRAKAMMATLVECWPDCFNLEAPKPLKINIDRDLTAMSSSLSEETDLRRALKAYTNSPAYLAALVEGSERVDLDGKPARIVTSGHAHHAQWLRRNRKA